MEYLNHKVLLHPRRAGASASRCWLPVHYGEVDALDGYHRPSHHLLKRASCKPLHVSIYAMEMSSSRLTWEFRCCFGGDPTSSASPFVGIVWELRLLTLLICLYVGLLSMYRPPLWNEKDGKFATNSIAHKCDDMRIPQWGIKPWASLDDPSWLRSHPSRSVPEQQMFLCIVKKVMY